jgi:hypothetical protein
LVGELYGARIEHTHRCVLGVDGDWLVLIFTSQVRDVHHLSNTGQLPYIFVGIEAGAGVAVGLKTMIRVETDTAVKPATSSSSNDQPDTLDVSTWHNRLDDSHTTNCLQSLRNTFALSDTSLVLILSCTVICLWLVFIHWCNTLNNRSVRTVSTESDAHVVCDRKCSPETLI